jgi:hypothetical protein
MPDHFASVKSKKANDSERDHPDYSVGVMRTLSGKGGTMTVPSSTLGPIFGPLARSNGVDCCAFSPEPYGGA